MTNRLDVFERREQVEFLAKDGVLEPPDPDEGLLAQALGRNDLPAKSACDNFGTREQCLDAIAS
jgi:hypothetical protein